MLRVITDPLIFSRDHLVTTRNLNPEDEMEEGELDIQIGNVTFIYFSSIGVMCGLWVSRITCRHFNLLTTNRPSLPIRFKELET